VVRRDRSFCVAELLADAAQLRVQRQNITMDVRTLPVSWADVGRCAKKRVTW